MIANGATRDSLVGLTRYLRLLFRWLVIGRIRDGKLKALAVGGAAKRGASLPDVPTLLEAGLEADAIYPSYTGAYLPSESKDTRVDQTCRERR
jgi:tripartite-type tricarboxylate transporter receptor subunit TctC